MKRLPAWLMFLPAACLLTPPAGVPAAEVSEPAEIAGIRVGFDGYYKVGVWTPVEIALRGTRPGPGVLSVTVPDCDGVPSRVSGPIGEGETSAVLYVRFGRVNGSLSAELQIDGQTVARRKLDASEGGGEDRFLPAVTATQRIVLAVGAEPLGVEDALHCLQLPADQRPVAVRLADFRQLPGQWYGYESIDALVISTSKANADAALGLSDTRIAALEQWIELGGTLVLCVGREAKRILAEDSPLAALAPGRLEQKKLVPLRQSRALEFFAGSARVIPRSVAAGGLLRVPRLLDVRGIVEAREADLPLVVRTARGFGQVVFLAADPDLPPLAQWEDRPMLIARLLDLAAFRGEGLGDRAAMMHYGYNDVSGQLRSALDKFEGVRVVPFWLVALLIAVYVALIGPVDYLFLRKCAGRMRWTWVTFPAVVLIFCLASWLLAHSLKGDRIRVNQLDLVDVDATSGKVRGTTWANVFAPPAVGPMDLSLRPGHPDSRVLMSWLGLPGRALGGMNPRTVEPMRWSEKYEFSAELDAMQGVRIQPWSTRSFTARWDAPSSAPPEADLADTERGLQGTITSRLDIPLVDCLLAYDRWVFELGTIEPGQPITVRAASRRQELKTLLTGLRTITQSRNDYRVEAAPYERGSLDASYVLRAMMFYEAAGGRRYVGLSNAYQPFVDCSPLLKTRQAVLVGRPPAGHRGAELLRGGRPIGDPDDWHATVYRFVLPVVQENDK